MNKEAADSPLRRMEQRLRLNKKKRSSGFASMRKEATPRLHEEGSSGSSFKEEEAAASHV